MNGMATTLQVPEQRVVLDNIAWDLYEDLLAAHRDRRAPRFTYDRGHLEIMSPSAEHEQIAEAVTLLVNIVAEEFGVNAKGFGSTTFRRQDLDHGFEPDACFYVTALPRVAGKTDLDLRIDPPPDLVIEVDIASSSLDKLSIMARLNVPEVWHYDRKGWRIFSLRHAAYQQQTESVAFPSLTVETIAKLVEDSRTLEPLAWIRRVRESVVLGKDRSRGTG